MTNFGHEMQMRRLYIITFILIVVATVAGCRKNAGGVDNPQPSAYYWRTVFSLDSCEKAFVNDNGIKRLYVRYFDVVMRDSVPMPNATLRFDQPFPDGVEVVPTVFIMENCMGGSLDGVAAKLVDRVLQMNETNDVKGVREIQIDCDWTLNSQKKYFAFLTQVDSILDSHNMRLSVTIRLHQLATAPPPADYGVLMMYNTGKVDPKGDRNPILDIRDVKPYLRHLSRYDLPLCSAWPCFGWNLLYSGNQFKAFLYDVNLDEKSVYRQVAPGHRVVIANRSLPEPNSDGSDYTTVAIGDSVITVRPTANQILSIVDELERERPGINNQVVIYSVDNKNINKYDKQFFKTLFAR